MCDQGRERDGLGKIGKDEREREREVFFDQFVKREKDCD